MTAEDLRAALRCDRPGCTCQRPTGNVHCPTHPDDSPSLSVRERDGTVLFKCHADCAQSAVLAALRERGLGPEGRMNTDERIAATYDYTDERGTLLFQVVRLEPKDFRQRRPDGAGSWIWNLDGVRRVPYHLREVLAAVARGEPVFIPEGEKDADRLTSLGVTATTNPGGAGKWRDEYAAYFEGARVVLVPHNDPSGDAHAQQVARSLGGVAAEVKVVRVPGVPPKGDVSDWLAQGHTVEELRALAERARPVEHPRPEGDGDTLRFVRLGDLLAQPEEAIPWLVEDRLPSAGLSLLAGRPKAGKSTLARCLALAVARGDRWLDHLTHAGSVLYLGLEEKLSEVRAHFAAMGSRDEPLHVYCARAPQEGIRLLRKAAEEYRPALIIVDPLLRLVRVRDANDYAIVTAALEPLLSLARETGAHVLTVHHLGKSERSGGEAILGSTAIFAAVDTALILKRTERYRTLSSIQRYGEDLEEITLALDPATRWVSAGLPRQEADQAQASEAVLEYLATCPSPGDEAMIHEAVEGRRAVKVRALRGLVAAGRVVRSGQGRKGDPYLYACATTDAGILVPTIDWVRGYENPKSAGTPHSDATNARSHDSGGSGDPSESREPAFRAPDGAPEHPATLDGEATLPPLAETARRFFNAEILSNRPADERPARPADPPALFPSDDGRQAPDDEPLATPEDLARGKGQGQLVLRIGEARAWAPYPYAPGRSIAAGKTAWITFVRNAPNREFTLAVAAVMADPILNGPRDV